MHETSIKVLIGSLINNLNNSKNTGFLCLNQLYLLNIIGDFINECTSNCINDDQLIKLKKLYINLQNKNKFICNNKYKSNNTFRFKNENINNFFGEMATFNININQQINLPPSQVGDGTKTTAHSTSLTFTRADFTSNTIPPYLDPEGDQASLLKILSLPSGGLLKLNGINVTLNQIITFADIDSGLFTYEPDPLQTTSRIEPFSFAIADSGSLSFTS